MGSMRHPSSGSLASDSARWMICLTLSQRVPRPRRSTVSVRCHPPACIWACEKITSEARILDGMSPPAPLFCNHRPRFSVWGPAVVESTLYAKSYGLLGARMTTEPRSRVSLRTWRTVSCTHYTSPIEVFRALSIISRCLC